MSQADELLEKLTEDDLDPLAEEHIVIGNDRYITVPEPLQRIAVQYDHNVETVTFDCPRYWDEHDLSTMYIYVNFLRADGFKGVFLTKNLRIDEADHNLIHFEWTVGQELSNVEGPIKFLVCAMETDEDGYERIHWNSEINEQMFVSTGLEPGEDVVERNESIITDLLTRLDALTGKDVPIDGSLTQSGIAADAAVVGEKFSNVEARLDEHDTSIETINNRLGEHDTTLENHNNRIESNFNSIYTLMNNQDVIRSRVDGHDADIEDIKERYNLIVYYNTPNEIETYEDRTVLKLNHKIDSYEENMIVKISTAENEVTAEEFNSRLLPYLTSMGTVDGFTIEGASDDYEIFDGDEETYSMVSYYSSATNGVLITCPILVNPKTIYISGWEETTNSSFFSVYGINYDGTEVMLVNKEFPATSGSTTVKETFAVNEDAYFPKINVRGYNIKTYMREFSIESGMKSKIKTGLNNYININGLGEKLINGNLEMNKNYELIYDGNVFNILEVK